MRVALGSRKKWSASPLSQGITIVQCNVISFDKLFIIYYYTWDESITSFSNVV